MHVILVGELSISGWKTTHSFMGLGLTHIWKSIDLFGIANMALCGGGPGLSNLSQFSEEVIDEVGSGILDKTFSEVFDKVFPIAWSRRLSHMRFMVSWIQIGLVIEDRR